MATRFYFPASTAADVSPSVDAGWNYVSEAVRRELVKYKGASAITVGTRIGIWTAGNYALDRQYVSNPIAAQTISGTFKMQLMTREYNAANDVVAILLCVKVVSGDGNTVRGTLLSLNNYGSILEFINAASHRNKTGADGDALTQVVAQDGDRIVVEIGYTDAFGTDPEANAKWGENATDLPENETQTTNGAGWVEFSGSVRLQNEIVDAGAIASAEAFGTASVNPGQVDITGAGAIASAEAFGTPAILRTISPTGIASAEAFGTPHVNNIVYITGAGGIVSAEEFGAHEIKAIIYPEDEGSTSRTIEVVRVGSINLDIEYPGKQVVRLRDLAALYEGKELEGLARLTAAIKRYKRKRSLDNADELAAGMGSLGKAVNELYGRMRGTRLSKINIEVWDQISGAYLGAYGTDRHGTLILPTDTPFVEVLQWKLAGGGYSDAFNGERGAGMFGLLFYFPCNEGAGGKEATTIESFPPVSGQQAEWKCTWYDSGVYNRPVLNCNGTDPLTALGADPQGQRSFQYLWYCNSPSTDYDIFSYSGTANQLGTGIFNLEVKSGKLQGSLSGVGVDPVSGDTTLQAETWYLIQINTVLLERWDPLTPRYEYLLQMEIYLGGTLELSVNTDGFKPLQGALPVSNIVGFGGKDKDGLDEIRHLNRELYETEVADYATFLKNSRIQGKSQGKFGSIGW
jgi:hypothetical protein